MKARCLFVIIFSVLTLFLHLPAARAESSCPPTRPDAEGPFYKPFVPLRSKTGTGLIIEGAVKSAGTCDPVAGARVEWWQTGPAGRYDDAHRGALLTDGEGRYRIETDFPPPYSGRPSHVHFKILAPGHRTLTTQVYPEKGQKVLGFDFVIIGE